MNQQYYEEDEDFDDFQTLSKKEGSKPIEGRT